MKVRAYIRVAKNGYKAKIDASTKSNEAPLHSLSGYNEKNFLPTVGFAIDLNIPDEMFSKASIVIAEINVANKDVKILSAIPKPEKKNGK